MRFSECGRVATFGLSLKTAGQLGVIPEDNEGLIDHLRAVRGVTVAVFLRNFPTGRCASACGRKMNGWMSALFAKNLAAAGIHSPREREFEEPSLKSNKKFWRKLVKPLNAPASPDGVLLVDKAEGMTSHDVVALARRKLETKKSAIAARSIRSPRVCFSSPSVAAQKFRICS